MNIHTRIVRFEAAPDDPYSPVTTPIYQTATFEQESATQFGRYDYSRSGNPTRTVLEAQVAALEHGTRGFAFASGLAAITAAASLVGAGEEIVACDDVYGGTFRLFSTVLNKQGITAKYVDGTDLEAVRAAIGPRTKLVHIETPTNPRLEVLDIRAIARIAHEAGSLLCVDSTAMSPYLQNPLDLGADIVVHSATKYLSGHSDVTAGVAAVKDAALGEQLAFVQNATGTALAPFEAFLLLRGIKTLAVRLDRQQQTALSVARFLSGHPLVERVYFPGLEDHPGHDLHKAQARGPGAVISFETGSPEFSRRVVESLRLFSICVSFGSVNSSVSLPFYMSHASVRPGQQTSQPPARDLVRLSIGLEGGDDLIADLRSALELARRAPGAAAEMKNGAALKGDPVGTVKVETAI